MSAYTTLWLYRPLSPPLVTGRDLARWISAIRTAGIFESQESGHWLKIKFGTSIDADAKTTMLAVSDPAFPLITTFSEIDWDIATEALSMDAAVGRMSGDDRSIYRADYSLGTAHASITEYLQTVRPDDGTPNLCLWDVCLYIGPVEICTIGGDDATQVGWMGVSFSGAGCLWPWSSRDLSRLAQAHPRLQRLAELCAGVFPIDRDNLGGAWGVAETG